MLCFALGIHRQSYSRDVQVRYMGPDAGHEEGVGRIPSQGGLQADKMATTEGAVWRLVLPPSGGCDFRGRFA